MRVHKIIGALNNIKTITKGSGIAPHFINLLRKSAKFDLGRFGTEDHDTFNALTATGYDIISNGLYAPPYPLTYVELVIDGGKSSRYEGVLSATSKWFSSIPGLPPEVVETLHDNPEKIRHFIIRGGYEDDVNCYGIGLYYFEISKEGVFTGGTIDGTPPTPEVFNDDAAMVKVVLALLSGLLTTRRAEVVYHPVAEKLNRARLKRGVEPTYAHHTIKIGGVSTTGRVLGIGATHASPRKHWRRGHVRVLHRDTSKEKKTLIPACLINGRGFISKEYSA